jgi:radical SAM protein with 4Fe4S-binding SPASM domain
MNPKDYFLHDALCPLPWIGVFVNPDGSVKNCAVSAETLGNLHANSFEEILLGQKNVNIKNDMLNHNRNSRCNTCYLVEDRSDLQLQAHSSSNRSWYKKYGINNLSLYDDPNNFKLKILDLRWRNTCNLACVYCGPDLSSKWADETSNTDYSIADEVLEKNKKYIFDLLENIEHIYLAGGEPLLIKENLELLNILYEKNPNVEIRINTNLSIIDNNIFKKLITFKNVKWTISVDSSSESYNYIRYPGNWSQFYKNLVSLKNQNFDINFNMVWCILNAHSIFDCIDELFAAGFHENTFIVQCLNDPVALDVRNLPRQNLEDLKLIIKNKLSSTDSSYWLNKSLNSMYNYINIAMPSSNIETTYEFLGVLDKRRNLDSRVVFPSLYNL